MKSDDPIREKWSLAGGKDKCGACGAILDSDYADLQKEIEELRKLQALTMQDYAKKESDLQEKLNYFQQAYEFRTKEYQGIQEKLKTLTEENKRLKEVECSKCRDDWDGCSIHIPSGTLKLGLVERDIKIESLTQKLEDQKIIAKGAIGAVDKLNQKLDKAREVLKQIESDALVYGDARRLAEQMIPNALKDIDEIRGTAKQCLTEIGE